MFHYNKGKARVPDDWMRLLFTLGRRGVDRQIHRPSTPRSKYRCMKHRCIVSRLDESTEALVHAGRGLPRKKDQQTLWPINHRPRDPHNALHAFHCQRVQHKDDQSTTQKFW